MASNPPYVSKPGLFVTLVTKAVFTVTNISVTIVRCYNSDLQAIIHEFPEVNSVWSSYFMII